MTIVAAGIGCSSGSYRWLPHSSWPSSTTETVGRERRLKLLRSKQDARSTWQEVEGWPRETSMVDLDALRKIPLCAEPAVVVEIAGAPAASAVV